MTQTDPPASPAETISVIVPCYNGRRTIVRCLEALQTAFAGDPAWELLVVDSSDDGTDRLVQESFPAVRLIHLEERTLPGPGRNLGAEQARGDLLLFVDADIVAPAGLALALRSSFARHPEQSGIVACLENGNPGWVSWTSFIAEFSGFFGRQKRQRRTTLPSFAVSFRRDAFLRQGGFNPELATAEDVELTLRMSKAGDALYLEPALRVAHLNRERWPDFLRNQVHLGRGFVRSRRLLPELAGGRFLRRGRWTLFPLLTVRGGLMLQRCFASGVKYGLLAVLLLPGYLVGKAAFLQGAWAEWSNPG